MKRVVLSHITALNYYREARLNDFENSTISMTKNLLLSKRRKGNTSIDIIVMSQNEKHKNWRFSFHTQKPPLPKNSIRKITDAISIVNPELLLIQLASELPIEALTMIAFEFCGTYSIHPQTGDFVSGLEPITNVKNVNAYIDTFKIHHKNINGMAKLKILTKVLADNAASPMEARLFIKLCGNRKYGFYGCKNLMLNKPVKISAQARKIAGQNTIIPDISCEDKKVAIEYNSTQFHENSEQGQKDRRRRDALVYDGWTVHSFVPEHLYDRQTFRLIAIKILKELGQNHRIRNNNFDINNKRAFELLR